jgi:hypothetical protein
MDINININIQCDPQLARAIDNLSIGFVKLGESIPRGRRLAQALDAAITGQGLETPPDIKHNTLSTEEKIAKRKAREAEEKAAKVAAKKAAKKAAKPEPTPEPEPEVTEAEIVRTEEDVTERAKDLIAKSSPAVLRAVLDGVIGPKVKISGAPKEKYGALYDAIEAKINELS